MGDTQLLGRGIYDAVEIARLAAVSPDDIVRWATPTQKHDALLRPSGQRMLSFYDLVTAVVTAQFRERGLPLTKIRDARWTLARQYDVEWPFAHLASLQALGSVGNDVYVEVEAEWVDASRGGQGALQAVVKPLLHRLEFDRDDMASLWRPSDGVIVNPRVQAGAPCIEGTRISTQFVMRLVEAGEYPADIAADFSLDPAVVRAAVDFEHEHAA